jgi:hypothetical protein
MRQHDSPGRQSRQSIHQDSQIPEGEGYLTPLQHHGDALERLSLLYAVPYFVMLLSFYSSWGKVEKAYFIITGMRTFI